MSRLRRLIIMAVVLLGPGSAAAADDQLLVFAAASLKEAIEPLAARFEQASGRPVTVSLAGSSLLARQIQHGAPADVFISANEAWMEMLDSEGLLVAGSRRDLLRNSLVLIAGAGAAASVVGTAQIDDAPNISASTPLPAMLGDGRLAMALTRAVPAGIYGRQALERLGLWPALSTRVAEADNVRAALALVASGEAPLGIVYRTDVLADERVRIVGTFATTDHDPIIYPAAAVAGGDEALASGFLDFLRGEQAGRMFRSQGFIVTKP